MLIRKKWNTDLSFENYFKATQHPKASVFFFLLFRSKPFMLLNACVLMCMCVCICDVSARKLLALLFQFSGSKIKMFFVAKQQQQKKCKNEVSIP
jgi:hypothetical protein